MDDASTDGSQEIIRGYQARFPEQIKPIFLKHNVGQAEATNIAIARSSGHYLTLLGSDDVATKRRLSESIEILERNPNIASVFSKVSYIDSKKKGIHVKGDVFNCEIRDLRWQLLERNFLCASSGVHRLDVIKSLGGYNTALSHVEDFDLWLRVLDKFDIIRVPQVWVEYRIHGKNLSAIGSDAQKVPLGAIYETVITILGAIQRWPLEKLYNFTYPSGTQERKDEEATAKAKLARHCLHLDRKYFLEPFLCTGAAYRLALDAALLSSENVEANAVLKEIYALAGDFPRAEGQRSLMISKTRRKPGWKAMKMFFRAAKARLRSNG